MAPPPHVTEVAAPSTQSSSHLSAEDDAPAISGIADWDEQGQPAHLPSAIKGLGPIERAQYFERQREKERADGEKLRADRRAALAASQARVKGGVDEHFTGKSAAHMLEMAENSSGGLKTHREFSGIAAQEAAAARLAEEEKEAKRAKKRARKKQKQDKAMLSFAQDDDDDE